VIENKRVKAETSELLTGEEGSMGVYICTYSSFYVRENLNRLLVAMPAGSAT
jgi:hypothetical protein